MSSFLCFICHNTVNSDTNDVTREKYREIIGVNLCPDSNLCYVCQHMVNKLWLFKSVCYKRSSEYPVLFSEKGTINLQRNETHNIIICSEESCLPSTQQYSVNRDYSISNDYFKLEHDHSGIEEYFQNEAVDTQNGNENHFGNDIVEINRDIENDNQFPNDIVDVNDNGFENDNLVHIDNDDHFGVDNTVNDGTVDDFNNDSMADVFEDDPCVDDEDNQVDNLDDDNDFEFGDEELKDEVNYTSYDDERSACLNEIRNEDGTDTDRNDTSKKKSKSSTNMYKGFEKIVLTLEDQKAQLEAQRRSKKYIEAEFKCYSCALAFLFKDTYQAHMMRHEESNGEYVCDICSLRFATPRVLRSHVCSHAALLACRACGARVRPRRARAHRTHCNKGYCRVTCHLCAKVFQDGSALQQHLKRFHMSKTSNRTYPCSVCGQTYSNQAAVRTHMIKHIHRKFQCDQCPSTFSSPYTLTQHKKKHSAEEKQHVCTCGVAYSSRKSLLAHRRNSINHQERNYECPICSRPCPNQRSLNSHIASVHSAIKNFKCTSCDARYSSRKSLVRHSRSHDGPTVVKPAVCHICGNSFKGKSKLNRHLKEVCEKDKLEEELSLYYTQQNPIENAI
ncbi:unnamed protein product [Chrysodeixis includens]|uniref:C2H2-type domain-containing protein n=1 Tax=Chrysodeixis includens TaxID=689277 RepID=A0A9P0C3C5_CHRIL|nr:unnamed protein product [Chrysodeixis includens]